MHPVCALGGVGNEVNDADYQLATINGANDVLLSWD